MLDSDLADSLTFGDILPQRKAINWGDEVDSPYVSPVVTKDTDGEEPDPLNLQVAPAEDELPPQDDFSGFSHPFPETGPFSAYIGNLDFGCSEYDIEDFFKEFYADSQIKDIRLIRKDGQPKGFGYIDFDDATSLREALRGNGRPFVGGRPIKVDIAPPRVSPRGSRRDRIDRRDDRRGGGRERRSHSRGRDSFRDDRGRDNRDNSRDGRSNGHRDNRDDRGRSNGHRDNRDDRGRSNGHRDNRDDRGRGRQYDRRDTHTRDPPPPREKPQERKKLQLLRRSTSEPVGIPLTPTKGGDLFGGARTREEVLADRKKEEKKKKQAARNSVPALPARGSSVGRGGSRGGGSTRMRRTRSEGGSMGTMGTPPRRSPSPRNTPSPKRSPRSSGSGKIGRGGMRNTPPRNAPRVSTSSQGGEEVPESVSPLASVKSSMPPVNEAHENI